jgi:ribonuclease BN (tRNA processing enzyme)
VLLVVIGSGTVAPSARRTAPAYWVEAGATRLLLDCGAGTLHRAAALDLPWHTVHHVAITHFHADHWGELPHFLFACRWGVEPARSAPLVLWGPAGLRERLGALAHAFGDWVLEPGFPLEIRELASGDRAALADDVTLECHATPHTAESLAYAVRHAGRRLVYTGDTGPSDALARWAAGCDLLLAECSLPEARAIDVHLTPARAGAMARDAKAKCLVLTHFYPQVEAVDAAQLAGAVFGGRVAAARDGDRFLIEA